MWSTCRYCAIFGASRLWEFPGGSPATSASIEQDVVYNQDGRHPIYLTVTDASGIVDRDTLYAVITSVPQSRPFKRHLNQRAYRWSLILRILIIA